MIKLNVTLTNVAEVTASLLDLRREHFLALTNPDMGIIGLPSNMNDSNLIEDDLATYLLVCTFGVTNLSEQVIFQGHP
jgi:hypothetical protein